MKKPFFAALIALLSASLACNAINSLGGGDTGGGSNGGTSGAPQQTGALFQDDFSNSSSGWDTVRVDDGITDYEDGHYRIYVNTTQKDIWANPGLSFGDVRVEVDSTKTAGPDDNDFGVICRYQDTSNFYFGLISSDGYTAIGKVKAGDQKYISSDKMQSTDAIHQGSASNHLRIDCSGGTLTLYVNGQQVATATDSDFPSGDVGLMAGTFDTLGTDISFDDFVVTKP